MSTPEQILMRYGLSGYVGTLSGNTVAFEVPERDLAVVVQSLRRTHRLPLKTIVATDERSEHGQFRIYYVYGDPKEKTFLVPYLIVGPALRSFPSLVSVDRQCAQYEKEIHTFFGLTPIGHPHLERINLHSENFPEHLYPLRKDFAWDATIEAPIEAAPGDFQVYEGEGVYEIPVGPVHAGIIEPGHFRFSVLGEEILRLEPRLGYVHKGTEKIFENVPLERQIRLAERVSGDSSFHHALAFVQALEALAGVLVPERARFIRVVGAELERLANHFGDVAFMMLDTGMSFGGSHGTRLRERVLRWNDKAFGHRFLRGVLCPGGVTRDLDTETIRALQDDLEIWEEDFREVIEAVKESDSLLNRLKGTGTLEASVAEDLGAVGIAARAAGQSIDARADFPYAAYDEVQFGVATEEGGDVYARYRVRIREVHQSFRILNQVLTLLPYQKTPLAIPFPTVLPKQAMSIGLTEGWRGDIVYCVMTDATSKISRVKVRDPSFLNWQLFPYVVTNDVVPDFPLINKSFNLSYTGNDL